MRKLTYFAVFEPSTTGGYLVSSVKVSDTRA